MTEDVKLKPCPNPWCGKSDPAVHRGGFRNRMVRVQCGTCGLHPPVSTEFEAETIAAWNRRFPSPEGEGGGRDRADSASGDDGAVSCRGCQPESLASAAGRPFPDELTRDEIRRRAKALLRKNGWRPGDKFCAHSVVQLMIALGLDLTANPATDRCGYPECGCDFDAVCDAAHPTPHHPGGRS